MSVLKKPAKIKQLKAELNNEFLFLQNIFSVLSIPQQTKVGKLTTTYVDVWGQQFFNGKIKIYKYRKRRLRDKLKNKQQRPDVHYKTGISNPLAKRCYNGKSAFCLCHEGSHELQQWGHDDFEMYSGNANRQEKPLPKRANTITELEERLEKIKSQSNFQLKNKLAKKSLASKLNKKIKKRDRINKTRVKSTDDKPVLVKNETKVEKANVAKPIFNNDGKLVFSKFDFAKTGQRERGHKIERDPKKILENLQQQEQKFRQLEEGEDKSKVAQLKEKLAWKNILQKAEGQKIKDDPSLLKKTIQKREQKKKQSKKQWDNRIESVKQSKDARQVKRKENIAKKKKEKKTKKVKTAMKRGRVVI